MPLSHHFWNFTLLASSALWIDGGSVETGTRVGLCLFCGCHPRALLGSLASSPPHRHPTQGGTPEKGVGPPQALSASLLPLPGPGRVTGAHGCPFPLRSPCHSRAQTSSGDTADRLDSQWVYLLLTHSISVLLRAGISGEVISSCNAESVERPLSHFSKHCLFQSRKRAGYPSLFPLLIFPLSYPACFQGQAFRILLDRVWSLSHHGCALSCEAPSRGEPGAHALQWGERGLWAWALGVTADPLPQPGPKILSLDKWLFKPKVLSRHSLKVPSS